MSVSIQISYSDDRELKAVTDRLKDLHLKPSRKEYKSGKFRRCYLRSRDAAPAADGSGKSLKQAK